MVVRDIAASRLKKAVSRLARPGRATSAPPLDVAPGCTFGAGVAERLKALEQGMGEVKGRLNGLIFVVIGAVVADLVTRLVA